MVALNIAFRLYVCLSVCHAHKFTSIYFLSMWHFAAKWRRKLLKNPHRKMPKNVQPSRVVHFAWPEKYRSTVPITWSGLTR